MPVFVVILIRIFPYLDWIRTRTTPNTDTFYEILILKFTSFFSSLSVCFPRAISFLLGIFASECEFTTFCIGAWCVFDMVGLAGFGGVIFGKVSNKLGLLKNLDGSKWHFSFLHNNFLPWILTSFSFIISLKT